jgi:hypothetical protein
MITRLTTPRRNKFLNSWPQSSQHQVATSFHQLMTILNTQELNINYICRHWFSFHSSILQLLRRSSFRQLASFWRSFPLLFPFVFAWSEVNISSNKFHNTTCHSGPFITMKWATTSSLVSTRNKFNNNRNYLILLNSQSIDSFSFSTRSSFCFTLFYSVAVASSLLLTISQSSFKSLASSRPFQQPLLAALEQQ